MRLGLIGLGRIGAFHAETLSHLPAVDSLVVTDAVARGHPGRRRAARRRGRRLAGGAARRGVDGIVIAAATDAHPELIRAGVDAGHARCSARSRSSGTIAEAVAIATYGSTPAGCRSRSATRAGSTRLHRRPRRSGERRARLGAHRAVHHPGPGTAARGVHRRLRRDLPRLQRPRLRHRPVGHRPGGRRGLCHRQRPGRRLLRRARRRRHRRNRCSPSTTAPRRWCPTPATTPRGHDVRAWSCTAPATASSPAGRQTPPAVGGSRCRVPGRASPTCSSWTASPTLSAPNLTAFTEVVAGTRPSPCTVDDALETGWVAEAATLSLAEHRPIRVEEARERLS